MPEPEVRAISFAPAQALRALVSRFVVVENFADRTNTLLPESAVLVSLRFAGKSSRDGSNSLRSVVTGLRDKPRVLSHSAGSGTIVAMLTPAGAAALVREPLETHFNGTMPLEVQVRRSQLALAEEQLAEASAHAKRVEVFQRFLAGQLSNRMPDRLVAQAAIWIRESRGQMRIESLARRAGVSQSALERRFRRETGASPKKFATIVRLRHVVRLRKAGAGLTEIAYEAGYTDQPHFIRDFKRFAGVSPEEYFASPNAFC